MMPPTTMNRARSEADRWRLVREFETSFQQVTVSPTGAGQATVLSSSGSRSWFPRRGSNTAQVDLYNDDYEEDDKSVGTHGSGHKHKHGSRVVSKHNTRKKDDRSSPSQQSMAAMTLSSPARSTASIRSSRRLGPQKQYSSKSVIQVSKRRPVEYDLSDWADPMRTPSPVAFIERKSSFFGRTWFAAPKPDTTSVPMSLAGFEPIIPQQSQSLPRQKSTFFARNNKASTSNMPGQPFENKPEAAHTEPPLMARSSSIFTKLFPRKRTPKYMDFSAPTTTAPSFQSDKETESEGSYEYDEEIAMASTSFDLTLPDQLLSEHQKSNRVVPDEDKYNPVDRWSPSPVPAEHAPEHMINITHNAHAPKRPIRQQSLKHNFDDDPLTPPALKTNLLQEREELLQQMKRVDHLLQGLMDDDAEHPPGETKAAEPTELVEHQKRQHPTLELDDNGRHEDAMDDDDSTYSMLSGIIASWMAERDAATLKSSCKGATNKGRLSVRFDSIIVREYERVVGDNPSCSSGPPISIGWNFLPAEAFPIDEYESRRGAGRTRREFYLPPSKRTDMLLQDWNCRPEDIRRARRDATYIQYCREKAGSYAGKSSKVTEAAFLRKANRKLQKNRPDVSDDTLQPPCVPTRPGSPFCDTPPPMSLLIQPSRQPSVAKLHIINDDGMFEM